MGNSISNLTRTDTCDASTLFAVSQNGQDYSMLPAPFAAYLDSLATTETTLIQYSAPSATGFSTTAPTTTGNVWLVLTPAANYAAGTINLPSSAYATENQEIIVNCTRSVTTLDVLSTGCSVVGHPTTLAVNGYFKMKYEPVLKTWYRVG
jgi:hypothetical protein